MTLLQWKSPRRSFMNATNWKTVNRLLEDYGPCKLGRGNWKQHFLELDLNVFIDEKRGIEVVVSSL